MTCDSWRSAEALDEAEADLELLRRLVKKYAARGFGSESLKALIRRGMEFAMDIAWCHYQDAATAQNAPDTAYWKAVFFFWKLLNWSGAPCRVLAEVTTYVAKAAARYSWPARWPFLAMAAITAEEKGCGLPDAAAEALGPEEHKKLMAFLERGVGVVEVAGRRFVVAKKKRHLAVAKRERG
jgi:hypothetical protein